MCVCVCVCVCVLTHPFFEQLQTIPEVLSLLLSFALCLVLIFESGVKRNFHHEKKPQLI